MGSSAGSQFFSEYPAGMRCLRASASVALGVEGVEAGLLRCELAGRTVCGRGGGTAVEDRRLWPKLVGGRG